MANQAGKAIATSKLQLFDLVAGGAFERALEGMGRQESGQVRFASCRLLRLDSHCVICFTLYVYMINALRAGYDMVAGYAYVLEAQEDALFTHKYFLSRKDISGNNSGEINTPRKHKRHVC